MSLDYSPDEKLIKRPMDDSPLTKEQEEEWIRCALDKYYFFEKYVKIQTDEGKKPFKARDYQKRMLDAADENRFVVCLIGRQSGKTQAFACDILHDIIFKEDFQIGLGSYKLSAVLDFMDRIRYAYENLPWWLKPPVVVYNKFSIKLFNNSSIFANVFSETFGRGKSLNRIILDELAFCDAELSNTMMGSLIPSISASGENSQTKLNIFSTPNGTQGSFYQIWSEALTGKSNFYPVSVKYEEIPGRTKAFEEMIMKTPGMTKDKFDQEFLCMFLSSSGTLVNSRFVESLVSTPIVHSIGDFDIFVESIAGRKLAVSCDPAEGVGEDSSAIQVFDIETFEQVGEYANNMVNQSQLVTHMVRIIKYLYENGAREIYYSYESNGIGSGMGLLFENISDPDFQKATMISDQNRLAKGKTGMSTTNRSKLEACGQLKDLMEMGKIKVNSQSLINEFKTFIKKGASFEAQSGNHDDRVSATILFVRMLYELRNYEDTVDKTVSEIDSTSESEDWSTIVF